MSFRFKNVDAHPDAGAQFVEDEVDGSRTFYVCKKAWAKFRHTGVIDVFAPVEGYTLTCKIDIGDVEFSFVPTPNHGIHIYKGDLTYKFFVMPFLAAEGKTAIYFTTETICSFEAEWTP